MRAAIKGTRYIAVLTACAAALSVSACGDSSVPSDEGNVTRTSTAIAHINIVDWMRNVDGTCGQPTALDRGKRDVARIVVADPQLLDAVCSLGLQSKVVATTTDSGQLPQYMGKPVSGLTTAGDVASPDNAKAAAARPDVVITSERSRVDLPGVRAIKATGDWKKQFQQVADGLGRSDAAKKRLADYDKLLATSARKGDASHQQISLVRFAKDTVRVEGTNNFAASVMTAMGVQRPAPQRVPDGQQVSTDDLTDADGDLIYVSYAGDDGKSELEKVVETDNWKDLGAAGWNKVVAVDDSLWYGAGGMTAATLVASQLGKSLGGYAKK